MSATEEQEPARAALECVNDTTGRGLEDGCGPGWFGPLYGEEPFDIEGNLKDYDY